VDTNTEMLLIKVLAEQLKTNATVRSELDALIETMKALHPDFQATFESHLQKISEERSNQPASQTFELILRTLGKPT